MKGKILTKHTCSTILRFIFIHFGFKQDASVIHLTQPKRYLTLYIFVLLVSTSTVVLSQIDSTINKHPKITLKFTVKGFLVEKQLPHSHFREYYYNNDLGTLSDFYDNSMVKPFLKDNKKAYRHFLISNISFKAFTVMGVAGLSSGLMGGFYSKFANPEHLTKFQDNFFNITGTTFLCSIPLCALTYKISNRQFIKAVKIYNQAYGYSPIGA